MPCEDALQAKSRDVPAHEIGAERAREKASVRQRGSNRSLVEGREGPENGNGMGPGHGDKERWA